MNCFRSHQELWYAFMILLYSMMLQYVSQAGGFIISREQSPLPEQINGLVMSIAVFISLEGSSEFLLLTALELMLTSTTTTLETGGKRCRMRSGNGNKKLLDTVRTRHNRGCVPEPHHQDRCLLRYAARYLTLFNGNCITFSAPEQDDSVGPEK